MKFVQISKAAADELTEAIRWYERQRVGSSRQMTVHGFPYRVVYRIREHDLYVVAIAHTSRRPDYWKHRV